MLVACDVGNQKPQNIVLGSVWVGDASGTSGDFVKAVHELRVKFNCWGTLEWKTSKSQEEILEMYKHFLELFFKLNIKFSAIIVNQQVFRTRGKHMGSKLSEAIPEFTKIHLTRRVQHFCSKGDELTILLHRGEHSGSRVLYVKRYLVAYVGNFMPSSKVKIKHIQEMPSQGQELLQLCDLLVGALTSVLNPGMATNTENKKLISHFEKLLGRDLATFTPYDEAKFNVWNWKPAGPAPS